MAIDDKDIVSVEPLYPIGYKEKILKWAEENGIDLKELNKEKPTEESPPVEYTPEQREKIEKAKKMLRQRMKEALLKQTLK